MPTETMLQKLRELHSFVRPQDAKVLANTVLTEKDELLGVYLNNPDDYILITYGGFHWIRYDSDLFIPFDSIVAVELPSDEKLLALVIRLDNGKEILLEVTNGTEDVADLYVMYEFLLAVIFFPHKCRDIDEVSGIASRMDLEDFLNKQEDYEGDEFGDLTCAMRFGFPKRWQLEALKIDPALLQREDVWRLLALFLSREPERSFEDSFTSLYGRSLSAAQSSEEDVQLESIEDLPGEIGKCLSPASREILNRAEQIAKDTGHYRIHLEFVLMALVKYDEELTCRVLGRRGMTPLSVRNVVKGTIGLDGGHQAGKVWLSASTSKLIRDAMDDESRTNKLLPEHLLWAMLRTDNTLFLDMLGNFERD